MEMYVNRMIRPYAAERPNIAEIIWEFKSEIAGVDRREISDIIEIKNKKKLSCCTSAKD